MTLVDRTVPTHTLVIEVPLRLDGPRTVDPVKTAMTIALSASHAAFEGLVCNDPQVSLREEIGPDPSSTGPSEHAPSPPGGP